MDNFIQLQSDKNSDNKIINNCNKKNTQYKNRLKYYNVIITLLALMVMPIYLYGIRVIQLLFTGLITALIVDFICLKIISKKGFIKYDYSSIITVLVIVMLMPATVPPFVVSVSVALGLCVAKYPFGGTGHNIFNPAAVGVAFSALCWPEYVLRYPVPYTTYDVVDMSGVQFAESPASILQVGGTPKIDFFNILLGKFSGPLGATCMIVLFACMVYLMFRHVISKRIVFSAFLVVCIFALIFPRVITGERSSILYELSSGAFIFGLIFMSSDPTTMPDTKNGRIFYGALIGLFVMMFRYFGKVEIEFVYAILLANVFASSCDNYAEHLSEKFSQLKMKKKTSVDKKKLSKAGETNA